MPTNHANDAAAASAGFTRIQGQTLNGESSTRYEKYVSGPTMTDWPAVPSEGRLRYS